jgi:protease-4
MKDYFVWLCKFLTMVIIIAIVIPAVIAATGKILESKGSGSGKGKRVAVIELKGEISDTKDFVDQLYKQADNKDIKGIVLRIDSPGGAVGPSQDIYTAVRALKDRKPIVASMGGMAASGGLYAAVGATKIFTEPGTLTGSIGVIMQVPNFTKISEKVGVEMITLKSGALKDAGNPFRPMTDEDRAYLQSTIGIIRNQFVSAVAEGRGIPRAEVEKFADGRVLTGEQAKELKLVDDFGDVYTAAREVFVLNKQPLAADENPELYYPGEKYGQLKELLKGMSSFSKILSNTFTPTAEMKYLLTW